MIQLIEQTTRSEWLARNPIVKRFVESNPAGWQQLPAFSIWPDANEIEGISEHQADKLSRALAGPIGIFGGSPGTGKTYTIAKLISHMLSRGIVADYEIGIGAPTGKAAVRLTENLQANGIDLRAKTWHSLLGIGVDTDGGGWTFKHNERNPMPYRVLFGDEESMKDLSLMLSVFKARSKNCHFLIVGDVNQLPPVGSGAPLRDMIAAGLPYGELTEIKRNSGGIVEACAAIRDCDPWLHLTRQPNTNITITGDDTAHDKIGSIVDSLSMARERGLDPIWDCQVLVAMNESSKLSRKAINAMLQDELNPGPRIEGTPFRPKDKIVCLKNGWYRSASSVDDSDDIQRNESGEVYVANGELGEVLRIEKGAATVVLENPRRIVSVSNRKSDDDDSKADSKPLAGNWDLGYALSGHKSQGSEWPFVIVVLDDYPGARMVCDRSWVYTAISRGRSHVRLIGNGDLAERFCRTIKINSRKTFLKELIQIELFKREIAEI